MSVKNLLVRRLGLMDYEPVWRAMQAFTDQRDENTPDELWIVEHPPVFTQGQAGRAEHILAPGDIPVIQVDRGGQVTYHGPGQIVAYPLIDIGRSDMDGAPGVYIDGVKIASLGLRIRRGKSFHGLSFNVDMDLEPFQRINPCGFQGLQVTNLMALTEVSMTEVEDRLITSLSQVLGYNDRFRQVADSLPILGAVAD